MTQSPFNVQYQGSSRAQGFALEEVPDVTPLLRQNLQTSQQNYQNLADAYASMPKDKGLVELSKFSETLTNTLTTLGKKEAEKRKAEGIALFYEDRAAQQAVLQEHQKQVAGVKAVDDAAHAAAADALKSGAPYDVADKLKGLSGWKKYGYAQAAALSAGDGYKNYMLNKLQNGEDTVVINPGTPQEKTVKVNDQNLTVPESAAVHAHLRTKYLQETGLANLSPALQAQAFEKMHTTDAELNGLARKEYSIRKSGEDEQAYITEYENDKTPGRFSRLLTKFGTLVDANGKPLGTEGAWKRVQQFLTDKALSGELVDFKEIYSEPVPWAPGKTFGELYGKAGQRLKNIENEITKAKIQFYRVEDAKAEISYDQLVETILDDLRSRPAVVQADIDRFQAKLMSLLGVGKRSPKLDEFAQTLTVDAITAKALDKEAEQRYSTGSLTTDFIRTLPPDLARKWSGFAEFQEKGMGIPESKTHLDALENHVKATVGSSSIKNLGGNDTLIIAELQGLYKTKVAKMLASGQFADNPAAAHNAAYAEVINTYNTGFKTKGSRYFYQNGFPNYMTQLGGVQDARKANQKMLERFQTIKAIGLDAALQTPDFLMNKQRLSQVVKTYGTPAFNYPPEVMYLAQLYNKNPLDILNAQLKAAKKPTLAKPQLLRRLEENKAANDALINRFPTIYRAARYTGTPEVWSNTNSWRPGISKGMGGLLNLIRSGEGGWNSMFPSETIPGLTNKTIAEVAALQKQKLRDKRASAAVGAYQFLNPEGAARLAGLPLTAKFTPENQNKMAIAYIIGGSKRPALTAYITGKSNDLNAAHNDIAYEWAALQDPNGKGKYEDGVNKASISAAKVAAALKEARRAYLAGERG